MNAKTHISVPEEITKQELSYDRNCEPINHGAVSIMISLGHKLGLFNILASLPPSTSVQVAEAASLVESYVRGWLSVMVVADIVDYHPIDETYELPVENSLCLTADTPIGNFAVYTHYIKMAEAAQQRMVECFKSGNALSYSDFPSFHLIMAEESEQTVAANMMFILAKLTPHLLPSLNNGCTVLDAGCGTGRILLALASLFPNSRFFGYDLSKVTIDLARVAARIQNLQNIEFSTVNLNQWQECRTFDLITSFDTVHDLENPQQHLIQIQQALSPGGTYLMQDIGGIVLV